MKTTLEVPDSLLRKVKANSARKGQSMGAFINAAIEAKLKADAKAATDKPWMRFAGIFIQEDPRESERIKQVIREECERIHEEDWQ